MFEAVEALEHALQGRDVETPRFRKRYWVRVKQPVTLPA
jgi:hypothetical protein